MATKSTISQNAVKLQEELNSEYLNSIKHEKDLLELARNRGKALVEILTSKEELNKLTEQEIEKNKKDLKTLQESIPLLEKKIKLIEQSKESYGQLFDLFLDTNREMTLLDKVIVKTFSLFTQPGKRKAIISGINEISKGISNKFVRGFQEAVMASDDAAASIAKLTGTGRKFMPVMNDVVLKGQAWGVGFDQAESSINALYSSMVDFRKEGAQIQQQLIMSTGKLEYLGISAEESAEFLNLATKALNQTSEGALEMQESMVKAAVSMGLPPKEMISSFSRAAPMVASYGNRMTSVFKNMAIQARNAGTSVEDLMSAAKKFDTFEGAATAAGRLNAMLGQNLVNSVDLLTLDLDEKLPYLMSQFEATGLEFSQLTRQEQEAIAGILELDTATTAKLFNAGSAGLEEYNEQQADMNKLIQDARTLSDRLKSTLVSLGNTILPLVEKIYPTLEKIVTTIQTLVSEHPGGLLAIFGVATAIKGVGFFGSLFINLKSIASVLGGGGAATGGSTVAGGMASTGAAAKAAGPSLWSMAGVILAIGASVWIASKGISNIAASFKELDPAQIWGVVGALGAFTVGTGILLFTLGAMGPVGLAAIGTLLALSVTFVSFGVAAKGIGEAAEGIGMMVNSLTGFADMAGDKMLKFFDSFSNMNWFNIGAGLLSTASGVSALALSLAGFAMIGAPGAALLGVFGKSISGLRSTSNNFDGAKRGGSGKEVHISLNLDGKVFKKIIVDTINEEIRIDSRSVAY